MMPFVKILGPQGGEPANPFLARLPLGEPDLHRQLGGSYFQGINCKWLENLRLVVFSRTVLNLLTGLLYIYIWYCLVFYQTTTFGGWRTLQMKFRDPGFFTNLTKWGPKICQPKKSLTWNNLLNWSDKSPISSCAARRATRSRSGSEARFLMVCGWWSCLHVWSIPMVIETHNICVYIYT